MIQKIDHYNHSLFKKLFINKINTLSELLDEIVNEIDSLDTSLSEKNKEIELLQESISNNNIASQNLQKQFETKKQELLDCCPQKQLGFLIQGLKIISAKNDFLNIETSISRNIKDVMQQKDNMCKTLPECKDDDFEVLLNRLKEELSFLHNKEKAITTTQGKKDISKNIHADDNTVTFSTDEKNNVLAATYITQGQIPFTYNDITKYFKVGDGYKNYIKAQYGDVQKYREDLLRTYAIKIEVYEYAKKRILEENTEYKAIDEYLEKEIQENDFHEKSELRDKINQYMSEYIINNYGKEAKENYEHFYWITSEDISKEFNKPISKKKQSIEEYETILKKQKLRIYEKPNFDGEQYYTANTENSIELDTYITDPNCRNSGLTSVIVFEGIKKHISKFFKNPSNNEIFLCSTLHRENLSSRYVSEFFGLKDSLFVNRRQGRDREVHICKISREEVSEYLKSISNKIQNLLKNNQRNEKNLDELEER